MPLSLLLAALSRLGGDHYTALGVPRGATADVIKKAYRNIAMKDHPDRLPRSATSAQREAAIKRFERANLAYETLGDPTQRRTYDFELTNAERAPPRPGAAASEAAAPQRPRVQVVVEVTLEQLAGFEPAPIPLSAWTAALGAPVNDKIAQHNGLPRTVNLPPGSVAGEVAHWTTLSIGVDVGFKPKLKPHPRGWTVRSDGTLHATVTLPAFHNLIGAPAVRIAGLGGDRVVVRPRGSRVARRGETVKVANRGFPRPHTGPNARTSERGELVARLVCRSPAAEAALAAKRLAAAACAVAAGDLGRRAVPAARRGLLRTADAAVDIAVTALSLPFLLVRMAASPETRARAELHWRRRWRAIGDRAERRRREAEAQAARESRAKATRDAKAKARRWFFSTFDKLDR